MRWLQQNSFQYVSKKVKILKYLKVLFYTYINCEWTLTEHNNFREIIHYNIKWSEVSNILVFVSSIKTFLILPINILKQKLKRKDVDKQILINMVEEWNYVYYNHGIMKMT